MKKSFLAALCICGYYLLAPTLAFSETDEGDLGLLAPVTASLVESRLAQAEAATTLDEKTKATLVDLYSRALSNLRATDSYVQAAAAFKQALETAAAEIKALHQERDATGTPSPARPLDINPSVPLQQLELILQQEKASLAAIKTSIRETANGLQEVKDRPSQITTRLAKAKAQLEEASAQLKLPLPADEGPVMSEARRWAQETRYQALRSEIAALDQELLSQPDRRKLLEARLDNATTQAERPRKRVKTLDELIARKRQEEADQALADAEATRREVAGDHPLVIRLAQENADLSEEIAATASSMKTLTDQTEEVKQLARQIEEDFNGARESIEIGGLSQELGQMLLQRSQSLPDTRMLRRQVEERENKAAEIGVKRLRHRREAKPFRDMKAYVTGIAAEVSADASSRLYEQLQDLGSSRKTLLERALESDDIYLRTLGELESAQKRLLAAIEDFTGFLDEHLLWIRSASRTELEELGALPDQVWRILSPTGWLGAARTVAYQATHSPVFGLLVVGLIALLWSRKRLLRMIEANGRKVGKAASDSIGYSVHTLLLTLIAAAAWPLALAVIGWQLKVSPVTTDFANAVGGSLLDVATHFFYIRAFWWACIPGGLAAVHFRWSESSLKVLRTELKRLTWIYLPAVTVTNIAFYLDPLNVGWLIGRAAFVILVASVSFAFYRVLHPKHGALTQYMRQPEKRAFRRLHRIVHPILVAAPLALGLLSLAGYVYTAGILMGMLLRTAWMVVGLVGLNAFAQRWLRVTRRHLAYEADVERREAELDSRQEHVEAHAGMETGHLEVEQPELDLDTLSDTSLELLNTIVVASGLIGLWFIWSDVFPAFGILNDHTLWHTSEMVDGESVLVPVTLANIGLTLVYAAATVILAKKLPAVLEIILLQRFDMSSGSRYAVTTLTNYAIVAVGVVLVLGSLGLQWSQMQWLVAALGVGIGFGLQEIVANFISGIIILFERPVRVGDIVTVGDTDGVVTKIRIRATTIRNWDRKELLVPNKEFITGRLLNWSLSDQTTRIVVVIGVAYGSDVDKALELMKEAAVENEFVMDDPPPVVSFEGFGDNALTLLLRTYIDSIDVRIPTVTELHKSINRKFAKAGIVIAFPQRDLHMDTNSPLRVVIEPAAGEPAKDGAV